MIYVNLLIVTPLAANFIAEWSGVMEKVKWTLFYRRYTRKTKYIPYRLKPFDCGMCLSFWLALVQVIPYGFTYLLLPFAAAAIGALISRL